MAQAAPASALNPPIGVSLVILVPIVLTMRQPPNMVPSAMTVVAQDNNPIGDVKTGIDQAFTVEEYGNDANRFLRVIHSMTERIDCGRSQLQFSV